MAAARVAASPSWTWPRFDASVRADPPATLVICRSAPAAPTDTVLSRLFCDPVPRVMLLLEVVLVVSPIATDPRPVIVFPLPMAVLLCPVTLLLEPMTVVVPFAASIVFESPTSWPYALETLLLSPLTAISLLVTVL
ncbi:hypothetical protein F3G58_30675 [Pseudomonas aeruginosa]|nr:hypothetical protein F3H11_31805 [Pseudomonas aeruginosa]KAA5641720.1 hypothetical protein F3G63_22050 [Pseudomonas aeruginosa]KAA5655608.1 hypothetical protein F3G58_30675 [Pseudomonas aeruginosa]MCO3282267.1 hypothetical protein [Pseudomonas aeruginosa]